MRVAPSGRGGRDLRHPRGRDPAFLRCPLALPAATPRPRAPRAGCRPCRGGLCPSDRPGGGLRVHVRPRGHQPDDRPSRCQDGLDAVGGHYRAGGACLLGHRRLPGMRHHHHGQAAGEEDLPGDGWQRAALGDPRGFPSRPGGPAWASAHRHSQGRPGGAYGVHLSFRRIQACPP
jgi:hypothetical protein